MYHQKKKSSVMGSGQGWLVRKVLQAASLINEPPLVRETREPSKGSIWALDFHGNLMSKNSHYKWNVKCAPSCWNDMARRSKFSTRNSFNMSWYTAPGTVLSAQRKSWTVFVGYSSKGTERMLTFEEGTDPEESDAAGTRKLTKSCLHEEQGDATQGQYRQIWHQERP